MAKPITITWSERHGQYRKTMGKYVTAKGATAPRDFWLGDDQQTALHLATVLLTYWTEQVEPKGELWTPERERRARAIYEVQRQMVTAAAGQLQRVADAFTAPLPQVSQPAAATPAARKTMGQAVDGYVAEAQAKRLSEKHVKRARSVWKQVYTVLPENTPLAQIDRQRLVRLVGHYLARPTSELTEKPLSAVTVKTIFTYVKAVLQHADDAGLWDAPKSWQRLFRVRWGSVMTVQEQKAAASGKDTFTDQELADLYEVAADRTKLFILLALNTAMNQREISTLLAADIDLKAGRVSRIRHKTRATAATHIEWSIWPETVQAIRKHTAGKNERGLAFLTDEGNELVSDATNTDSVALAWARLHVKAKNNGKTVRRLPFGCLRKTAATWVRNHASEAVQQQLLGHAPTSVASRHYTGRQSFERLDKALAAYRQELLKAGVLPAQRPATAA